MSASFSKCYLCRGDTSRSSIMGYDGDKNCLKWLFSLQAVLFISWKQQTMMLGLLERFIIFWQIGVKNQVSM